MNKKLKLILSLSLGGLLMIPLYIILHEAGHCLVALMCGAEITAFSVWGAYMSYAGGTFNAANLALLNAAGMLFPVSISLLYMVSYQSDSTGTPYRLLSFLVAVIPLSSILAWISIPILYLFDKAPLHDDVTRFIINSGLHPLLVVVGALTLLAFCFFVAWQKKIILNFLSTLKEMKEED